MIQQGDLVDIDIIDISSEGYGIGKVNQQVIFIPDTVTGDRIQGRIVKNRKKYAEGKIIEIKTPSQHRIRPRCIVADKCGGCQWQHIDYQYQLETKVNHIQQNLTRIGGFEGFTLENILSGEELGYRNKVNYPLGVSATGKIKAGYYQKASHDIVNINQCPIQDQRLNAIFAEIKQDLQTLNIPIYNEKKGEGELRHLCFRIGRQTGEILLTLVSAKLSDETLEKQAQKWLNKYDNLVGICLNHNPKNTNVILGQKTELLAGRAYIREKFANLTFHLPSDTFFQINTMVAEKLLSVLMAKLNLTGEETVLDLYSGIGTFSLPIAQKVKKVIAIESFSTSVTQAKHNAEVNDIDNVQFEKGLTEEILPTLEDIYPDIVILDPPRKGCQPQVIENLLRMQPQNIVYISCHPATLARDLRLLCEGGIYQLSLIQPADFFPQTPHVETAVILKKTEIS